MGAGEQAEISGLLKELEALLRDVVASGLPPRTSAVRYTQCRDALLASPQRGALPGFVVQCVSISKFQDFITLYDPGIDARLAFLDGAFGRGEVLLKTRQRKDAFNDFDF